MRRHPDRRTERMLVFAVVGSVARLLSPCHRSPLGFALREFDGSHFSVSDSSALFGPASLNASSRTGGCVSCCKSSRRGASSIASKNRALSAIAFSERHRRCQPPICRTEFVIHGWENFGALLHRTPRISAQTESTPS